jgi:hypothetical protein
MTLRHFTRPVRETGNMCRVSDGSVWRAGSAAVAVVTLVAAA